MDLSPRTLLRDAALTVGLGVLFAWFGVYQTAQFPFVSRVLYWTATIATGVVAGRFIMPLVFEQKLASQPMALKVFVAAAAISLPVTMVLLIIEYFGFGIPVPLAEWPISYAHVLVVSLVLTFGFALLDIFEKTNATLPASGPDAKPPAIIDRLPAKLRSADIYAVSSEDHYLRIHTSAGEELILMRLTDAIRELDGIEGLQTHRSWWVARHGLAEAARTDGKLILKLKSGAAAPVSRTYRKSVEAAGWA